MSYVEDVKIDRYKLDEILESNASEYIEVGDQWAEAEDHATRIKEQLDLAKDKYKENLNRVRAELFNDLRTKYEKEGFDKKPTDKQAENWVIIQGKYKKTVNDDEEIRKLTDEYHDAVRVANRLKIAKKGYEIRSKSIEGLIYLHGKEYWSEKVHPLKAKENKKQEDKEFVEGQLNHLNRKRRIE